MARLWRRSRCALTTMVFLAGIGGSAQAATVAVNGSPIPAWSVVSVAPGDRVTCEILISDFGDVLAIRTYQAGIEPLGWVSGDGGALIPIGWEAPFPIGQNCTTSAECPVGLDCLGFPQGACSLIGCMTNADCPSGLVCACPIPRCTFPICAGSDHAPTDGAFIDTDNPRFVHFGKPAVNAVFVGEPNYIFGSAVLNTNDATADTGVALYAGTVDFRVSDNSDALGEASGTFVLGFRNGLDFTFLLSPDTGLNAIAFETLSPLTVNVAPLEEIIPTTSTWGLVILALLLACVAKIAGRTRIEDRRRLVV